MGVSFAEGYLSVRLPHTSTFDSNSFPTNGAKMLLLTKTRQIV